MIIQAEMRRKQSEYEGEACVVDKVIELPSQRFKQFSRALLADYDFIAENKNAVQYEADSRHCLLILDVVGTDGFLVDPQGYNYARYSAFVPNVRSLLTPDVEIDRSYLPLAEPWRDESRDEMLRMTLHVDGKPDYTLVLPADEKYLDAVKAYLDIDVFADAMIEDIYFKAPYIGELICDTDCPAVEDYNDFAEALEDIWQEDGMLNTGVSRNAEPESSLSQILEDSPHPRYYLSPKACLGILRRAKVRGKPLPKRLEAALLAQAGLSDGEDIDTDIHAYHINQRNEGIDLHGIAGALMATQNLQMQTFVAGFSPGAGSSAGSVGYTEDVAPTLKSADGGNTTPAVLRLYENHGIDSRYKGPFDVAPTLSARAGTGGGNLPLVDDTPLCIAGNVIDRQPQNGGNGSGVSEDLSYTITATDRHAVFARQRVDVFQEDDVVSTQSARQYKDATDLVYDSSKPFAYLIRRLTPLECERLQGFPDGWTDIPGASDSARYKALGNSVAIPCVDYIMHGVAAALNGD